MFFFCSFKKANLNKHDSVKCYHYTKVLCIIVRCKYESSSTITTSKVSESNCFNRFKTVEVSSYNLNCSKEIKPSSVVA